MTTFYGYDTAPQVSDERSGWPKRRAALFAEGNLFLVEGPHMRQRLIDLGCPADKVEIQRIAISPRLIPFRAARPRGPGPVRLFFAGRFVEKKGLLYALEAVGSLARRGKPIELHVVGDGPLLPQVQDYIASGGLEAVVHLHGFLSFKAYLDVLQTMDIFLQPSVTASDGDTEGGAPTTVLEAQAAGLPVVATNHADIPYVVREGESALLVAERDVGDLSRAIEFLVEHPERWAAMGRAGRAQVEACHDVDRQVVLLEQKYDRLISSS